MPNDPFQFAGHAQIVIHPALMCSIIYHGWSKWISFLFYWISPLKHL